MNHRTPDVLKKLDIPNSTLRTWQAGGFAKPSVYNSTRQGEKHFWSDDDLYYLCTFKELISLGIPRGLAKEFAQIDFSIVGPNKGQVRYAVLTRGFLKNRKDMKFTKIELKESVPAHPDKTFAIVINLLDIKESMDIDL